jgi:hypothetical protein
MHFGCTALTPRDSSVPNFLRISDCRLRIPREDYLPIVQRICTTFSSAAPLAATNAASNDSANASSAESYKCP